MSYAGDLTDEQWALLEPVFNAPSKRGPKSAPDLRPAHHLTHMHVARRDSPAERSSAAGEVRPAAPALGHCSGG
jgi:transposase